MISISFFGVCEPCTNYTVDEETGEIVYHCGDCAHLGKEENDK